MILQSHLRVYFIICRLALVYKGSSTKRPSGLHKIRLTQTFLCLENSLFLSLSTTARQEMKNKEEKHK
jgi:hypothetical protein